MHNPTDPAQPLVSVIVPTYDRPQYLPLAIESAIRQTYRNIEIIVTDNAGNPENYTIVSRFVDDRIRYRRNAVNLGITQNHLVTFAEAQGKYIAILHDDDMWEENFLEKLVPHLEADPDLVLSFADHYLMDASGRIDHQFTEKNTQRWGRAHLAAGVHKPFYRIALVDRSVPIAMATVFRKDAIAWEDFPPEINTIFDLWLAYLICRTGRGAYYHPERLTRYRTHAQTETATGRQRINAGFVYCYWRILKDAQLPELKGLLEENYAFFSTNLGIDLLRIGQTAESRFHLLIALKLKPSLRALVALLLGFLPEVWLKNLSLRVRTS